MSSTAQYTLTSTPTLICPSDIARIYVSFCSKQSGNGYFLGLDNTVSATTGYFVQDMLPFDDSFTTGEWWAVNNGTTCVVTVLILTQ